MVGIYQQWGKENQPQRVCGFLVADMGVNKTLVNIPDILHVFEAHEVQVKLSSKLDNDSTLTITTKGSFCILICSLRWPLARFSVMPPWPTKYHLLNIVILPLLNEGSIIEVEVELTF